MAALVPRPSERPDVAVAGKPPARARAGAQGHTALPLRNHRIRCSRSPPSPSTRCVPLPLVGRGIAYGFEEAIAGSHKMDLVTPRAQRGVGWRNSRRLFDGCRTPGRTTHGTSCWRFCSLLLRRHCVAPRAPRTWPRLGNPRKGCCGWSCSCSTGCPATILSAGSSACWTRRRSRPHSAGSWQASPRPTDWNCAVWWRWMAKPCAVPSSVAGKAPRCTWSTSGQRRRECAWLSAKLPAATRQRGRWKSWACWTSKAVSLPRMHCTAIATLPPRCSSGVRIYVLALKENQSKLFAAAARRYARSGARSVAERREPATHDRCEWRRATVLRDTTFAAVQKFPGVVALARITSRRRVLGACAEPPQVRYSPALQIYSRQATAAHRALPVGIENQLHSGTRCRLQRGSQPNSQRQRAREPCYPPKARPQSGPQSPRGHVPAPENQTRGVGRRLPLGHARSYAIARPVGRG